MRLLRASVSIFDHQAGFFLEKIKVDAEAFYAGLRGSGTAIRGILWPLEGLSARERAVFTEYHYWNTHMKVVAMSHRISLGRAYEILYRAEEKIAVARAQKEKEAVGSAIGG